MHSVQLDELVTVIISVLLALTAPRTYRKARRWRKMMSHRKHKVRTRGGTP